MRERERERERKRREIKATAYVIHTLSNTFYLVYKYKDQFMYQVPDKTNKPYFFLNT